MLLREEIWKIDKPGRKAKSIAKAVKSSIPAVYRHRKWIRENPEYFRNHKPKTRKPSTKRETNVNILTAKVAGETDPLRRLLAELELDKAKRRSEGAKKAAATRRRKAEAGYLMSH